MSFLKVGLTGGIACGKSVVRRRMESRGIATLDADTVVHGLLGPGTEVTGEIAESFGDGVLASDGSVDRKKLGAAVFADQEKRARLNGIVHPRVFDALDRFFGTVRGRGDKLAVVDAALMVETGSYRNYDRLIVVYCPRAVQKERLMARDQISSEEADRRIAAQMPIEEKRDYADYVIDTSHSMEETLRRTDALIEVLVGVSEASADPP